MFEAEPMAGQIRRDEPFRIEVRESETRDLLALAGSINQDAALRLKSAAQRLADGSKAVAIDWREAEHISAGALQVLLALSLAVSNGGRVLEVVGDRPEIRHIVELAGLSGHFPVSGKV